MLYKSAVSRRRSCYTNSNAGLVQELYSGYDYQVIESKRHITCNGSRRTKQDVIVTSSPDFQFKKAGYPEELCKQIKSYPNTRYMGSKSKLLPFLLAVASQFQFETVADLFAGS